MATDPLPNQEQILALLDAKAGVKAAVYDQALDTFNQLKDLLSEISNDLNEALEENPAVNSRRIKLEYRDRGKFEAELKFADDVLLFSMHTDVFQFDRDHAIWRNSYAKSGEYNTYCGVISVYNFLSDSLKYNRLDDVGYLVARLFVNREKRFFVEGKRQSMQKVSSFGKVALDKKALQDFVQSAMLYCLQFDLLVPPFDLVKAATLDQINSKIESTQLKTGKRLGFKYNSDDVLSEE